MRDQSRGDSQEKRKWRGPLNGKTLVASTIEVHGHFGRRGGSQVELINVAALD